MEELEEKKEEDLEERVSFLENGALSSRHVEVFEVDKGTDMHYTWRRSRLIMIPFSIVLCTILVSSFIQSDRWNGDDVVVDTDDSLFACPMIENEVVPTNDSGESFEETYAVVSRNITTDKNEFLKTFRTESYDGWGKSYNDMKEGMTHFKSKFFGPYLKPGMKMYESACGIGLNLLMTLEILQELQMGVGITVYGNEYVQESVEISEVVLGEGVIPAGNHRGVICTGDSTNLSHVPSNSFDLVYTGYITPILDPLDIDPDCDNGKYEDICESVNNEQKDDWMAQKIWEMAQERQRDWYGKWVGEMARIAKPGAPVIVEQVSHSYCRNLADWGGVDKKFWKEAAAKNSYNWNIDPKSIETERDSLHLKRYHVFMLKNEG